MDSQPDTGATGGVGGQWNWLVGGAAGGLAGSALFGVVLWLVDPAIVSEAVPQLYGVEPGGTTGWAFHLLHGLVLGTVFGFLVTRGPVLGTLTADVETPFLDAMGPNVRITLAGLVYGLAVWVIGPGVVLTVVVQVGDVADPFPWGSVYSLLGHLLYGLLLGALVSLFTDVEAEIKEADAPFEEANGS